MNPYIESRPRYDGAWAHNPCTTCDAQPFETCVWTGTPNDRFPEPVGTPRAPHAGRKYYTT